MTINLMINSRDLVFALRRLVETCECSYKMADLTHFYYIRFDGYGDHLKLSAYNSLRKAAILINNVSSHQPFSVGVSGALLDSLKGLLPDGNFSLSIDNKRMLLSKDIFNVSLAILSGERFPQEQTKEHKWVRSDYEEIFNSYNRVRYCIAGSDAGKPYTRALNVTKDYVMCTDGFRMSVYPNRGIPVNEPMLLHPENMNAIVTTFTGAEGDGYIEVDENEMTLSRGGIYMATRIKAGHVPNFTTACPSGPHSPCVVKSTDIITPLKRMLVVAGKDKRSTPVQLTFGPNIITLLAERDGHRIRDHTEAVYSGGSLSMEVNGKYLLEAINEVGSEEVIIELRGQNIAIVITDDKGEHKNVILPIKS